MFKMNWIREEVRNQRTDDYQYVIWHGSYGFKCALYKCVKQEKIKNGVKRYYKVIGNFSSITDAKEHARKVALGKVEPTWDEYWNKNGYFTYLTIQFIEIGKIWAFENLKEEIK